MAAFVLFLLFLPLVIGGAVALRVLYLVSCRLAASDDVDALEAVARAVSLDTRLAFAGRASLSVDPRGRLRLGVRVPRSAASPFRSSRGVPSSSSSRERAPRHGPDARELRLRSRRDRRVRLALAGGERRKRSARRLGAGRRRSSLTRVRFVGNLTHSSNSSCRPRRLTWSLLPFSTHPLPRPERSPA